MTTKTVRAGISTVVILGALVFLISMTVREEAQPYRHVDEVMPKAAAFYGKPMKLHGFVVGDVRQKPKTLEYRFDIKYGDAVVNASYTGTVPDTFKTGSEIVLSGKLSADGFVATDMTAKCPSRYEAGKTPPGQTPDYKK